MPDQAGLPPPPVPRPNDDRPPQGSAQPFRAFLVVVVGVVVAVFVLARTANPPARAAVHETAKTASATTRPPVPTKRRPPPTTTTTVVTTTTSTTLPPSSVTVLVLNGWTTYHAALYFQHQLGGEGYDTRAPANALSSTNKTSQIFYTSPAYRANALAIAAALKLPSTDVVAPTAANDLAVPAVDLSGADIIVLVGADISGRVPAGYNG